MTEKELKWYVASKIGSKINKTIIKENKRVYKTLQLELQTDNIDCILNYLLEIGFVDNRKSKQVVKEVTKEELKQTTPKVEKAPIKIYYIEPKPYEKPKDIHIEESLFKQYSTERLFSKNKRYEARVGEDFRKKVKYGLSKPYYRENTDYSSIW